MEGSFSLITVNADKVGEAAKVFIEKVSDGVGGLALPWQMRRKARAEVASEKIKKLGEIELNEIEAQAIERLLVNEVRKQKNIEDITYKSSLHVNEENDVDKLDQDWIADFFSKCENISNVQMQEMWARILAGEANKAGTFSKKTIDLVSKIDTASAELFSKLCSYIFCAMGRENVFIFYSEMTKLLGEDGIRFTDLQELASDGLIHFDGLNGYQIDAPFKEMPGRMALLYHKKAKLYEIDSNRSIDVGNIYLTRSGREVASICNIEPKYEAYEIVKKKFVSMGFKERSDVVMSEEQTAVVLRISLSPKFC